MMRFSQMTAIAAGLLLLAGAMVRAGDVTPDQAIAKIKELGGRVTIDPNSPNREVIGVILDSTRVTDADLKYLAALPHLRTLRLGHTGITDAGLAHLKGMPGLRTLWLDNLTITDAGMKHLKGLTNLTYFNL